MPPIFNRIALKSANWHFSMNPGPTETIVSNIDITLK